MYWNQVSKTFRDLSKFVLDDVVDLVLFLDVLVLSIDCIDVVESTLPDDSTCIVIHSAS